MSKLHKEEAGFSTVEAVLILVIVALVGVVGFMVYKNQHKTTTTSVATAVKPRTATPTKTTSRATQTTPFVNVIQDDSTVIQVTPDKIAKTDDEITILTALHDTCTDSLTYVTVNHVVFDGNSNFIQGGSHAKINASVCTGVAKTLDDIGGSGSANYLHKNSSGAWTLDTSSQMTPSCAKVDGLGYPMSIISSCYDGSAPRAPK